MAIESEKLRGILYAQAPFDVGELDRMSDADGWAWVYRDRKPRRDVSHQILFTGFTVAECAELTAIVQASGWLQMVSTVTKTLAYLCCGPNAGPAKVAKAKDHGALVLTRSEFDALIANGELPAP